MRDVGGASSGFAGSGGFSPVSDKILPSSPKFASCASVAPTVSVPATARYAIVSPPTGTAPSVIESGGAGGAGAGGPVTPPFASAVSLFWSWARSARPAQHSTRNTTIVVTNRCRIFLINLRILGKLLVNRNPIGYGRVERETLLEDQQVVAGKIGLALGRG